jgi:CDP-glucose 4,6-dehydratase
MHPGKYGEMKYKEIFENTYRGKKVLLTGHTGFKGSWMLAWLHRLGAEVKGYALQPENENDLYNLINGNSLCHSVIDDIRNKEIIKQEILSFHPDFIFHLAAQPLVRESYKEPLYTFEVNVSGTANLLDAIKELNKPCSVVIVTTDKVYENIEQHYAYKEEDKLGGYDPYSASKAAAEIVVGSYRNSFFNPAKYDEHKKAIASARAGNVIGGGDRAKDRIIPDIIRGIEMNEPVVVRNPQSVRPWQHVLEPLSGYLLLGKKLAEQPSSFSSAWNLGPSTDDVLTVKEVVEKAIEIFGRGNYSTPPQINQPHEAALLQLNISKAQHELGWQPKLNSKQAIEWTMQWYKNADKKSVAGFSLEQINQYEQL